MRQSLAKIEKQTKDIIFKYLNPKQYQVFIFGSRASGRAMKFSDYDIGVWGKNSLPSKTKILIEESLEESNIPCKIDIVDFSLVSSDFRKIALSKIKKI